MRPGTAGSPSRPQCRAAAEGAQGSASRPRRDVPPAGPGPGLTSDLPAPFHPAAAVRGSAESARRSGPSSRSLHRRAASTAAFYAGAQSQRVGGPRRRFGPRGRPREPSGQGQQRGGAAPSADRLINQTARGRGGHLAPPPPTGSPGAQRLRADAAGPRG